MLSEAPNKLESRNPSKKNANGMKYTRIAAEKTFLLLLEMTTFCPGLAPMLFLAIVLSSD